MLEDEVVGYVSEDKAGEEELLAVSGHYAYRIVKHHHVQSLLYTSYVTKVDLHSSLFPKDSSVVEI